MNQQLADLRGSHFVLGNSKANNFATSNQLNFTNKAEQSKLDSQNLSDNALRASHFTLNGKDKNSYATTHLVSYPMHPLTQAKLSQETMDDLRSHHFKVGQYGPTTQTTNNIQFPPKQAQHDSITEAQKQAIRKHHHNFEEQRNNQIMSTYGKDFNNKGSGKPVNAEELKQKNIELRTSNIILGNDRFNLKSTQQKDYSYKQSNKLDSFQPNIQGSNFQLGDQKENFKSTNNEYFQGRQIAEDNTKNNEQLKADLRQTHWCFGQQNNEYKTEFSRHYTQNNNSKAKAKDNELSGQAAQKDSWYQGNHPSVMKSVYADQHKQYNIDKNQQFNKGDRKSNFSIGNNNINSYKTEFSSNYGQQNDGKQDLDQNLQKQLRASHFSLAEGRPQYTTTAGQSYNYQKAQENKNANDPASLRSHNFHLGQQIDKHNTTYRRFFVKHENDGQGQLNKQQQAQLRVSHFQLG